METGATTQSEHLAITAVLLEKAPHPSATCHLANDRRTMTNLGAAVHPARARCQHSWKTELRAKRDEDMNL